MGTTHTVVTRRNSTATRLDVVLNLVLVIAGFGLAELVSTLWFDTWLSTGDRSSWDRMAELAPTIILFWFSFELNRSNYYSLWAAFVEQLFLGAGLALILQAALAYLFQLGQNLMFVVFAVLLATTFLTVKIRLFQGRISTGNSLLVVGFESGGAALLPLLQQPVVGFVGDPERVSPSELPHLGRYLGRVQELEQIVEETRPSDILIGLSDWTRKIPSTLLLKFRLAGIAVTDTPRVYEKVLRRVCTAQLQPSDLILSPALRADSRVMAIQSVYTNLIGLLFLFLLAPLLLLIAIAVLLLTGPGPVLESAECAGFQKIPFRLLRFRVHRRDGSGAMTWIGRVIWDLRLVNIPQVINVVRGEMALFGPKPVRQEFASRLTELIPYYAHRFSVKPGILAWGQVNIRDTKLIPSETLQIEYDLYHVKEASALLDLEILVRTLFSASDTLRGVLAHRARGDGLICMFSGPFLLAVGTLLVFYILIGYPLLLAAVRFRCARPVVKQSSFQSSVTIIIAVYNGASFLSK